MLKQLADLAFPFLALGFASLFLQGCDQAVPAFAKPVFAKDGGSRVTFEVDLEGAYELGLVDREANPPEQLMAQVASVMKFRLDPYGLSDSKIEFDGKQRITLELAGDLPGGPAEDGSAPESLDELARSPLMRLLSMPGRLEFLIPAKGAMPEGTDWVTERTKLDYFALAHPDQALEAFHGMPPEAGGPHPGLRWATWVAKTAEDAQMAESDPGRAMLTLVQPPRWSFSTSDVARVYASEDRVGFPAVGFELEESRKADFRAFTAHFKGHELAIAIDGQIHTRPTIVQPLPGAGIIQGRYSEAEMREILAVLRAGELPLRAKLVAHEYVEPGEGPRAGE